MAENSPFGRFLQVAREIGDPEDKLCAVLERYVGGIYGPCFTCNPSTFWRVRSDDLDFHYPDHLVAQEPCHPRDAARLFSIPMIPGPGEHRHVRDLPNLLEAGDLLVLNTTKVFPARLFGHKASGGAVEVLLVHPQDEDPTAWVCMLRGKVRLGTQIHLPDNCVAVVEALYEDGHRLLRFPAQRDIMQWCEEYGHIPLPPYIRREDRPQDRERYQSVFAHTHGSVAAPTASLHFTPELLQELRDQGVASAEVELRVGPGTFKPVQHEHVEEHPIHREWCHCPQVTIDAINACRARGKRVIAVGTTVVRTLHSAWSAGPQPAAFQGWTQCFLYPPQVVACCDLLLTNFHLPRSTLLALVSCFIEAEELLAHYRAAIDANYRLFSYGDAMLVPNRRLAFSGAPPA
ncbi:MAG: tRNA preQ1(34) S-adenosylmethionine ribosyltransferase-isomerase QueA [Planctomycetota bacterium]|nr:MAG: tRNA preQ1(34) S-adenosylmethionine ribosyltransferase-isomerase QueA [Planctomycetota bacterium]